MKYIKAYPILSIAAILVSLFAFDPLCYILGSVLEDHWKTLVATGNHAAYYSTVFSHPGVLVCLTAVLGTGIAAIVADARAICKEERGSLTLLILVCLALAVFAILFFLILKAL